MWDLKNRVALVTSASRGIGKAVALALFEAGAAVAVNYRERGEEAGALLAACRPTTVAPTNIKDYQAVFSTIESHCSGPLSTTL